MNKYGLHGKLSAKAGQRDKLSQILMKAASAVSKAKGCHVYIVSIDTSDSNSVWITEVWDSKEDHDNSLAADGVKELISQAMPLLDGKPEKGQELEVLGGFGIAK